MKNDCAVIINSCDSYQDLWEPFFILLKKNWTNCPYPIYLNTEKKSYKSDDLSIISILHNEKLPWSDRLIHSIKTVNKKYVILLLDDFLIDDIVNQEMLDKCMIDMEKDKNISVFSFYPSKWQDINDGKYENFELRNLYGQYRFNMQAAIWRTKDLLKILVKNETPWQAEERGTFRARVLMPKKAFYVIKKDVKLPFLYEYGGAIHRGKWTKDTPALLKRYGVNNIDYIIRGFDDRPTSDWAKMCLDKPVIIPKKTFKIKIGEYLLAKGILKWKQK